MDKASYRYRGGFIQKIITAYKIRRYFTNSGKGNLIRHNADFWLTDGAVLEIGNQSTILDYAFFQLTKPNPKVYIGNNVVIGRHCMITAKNIIRIGDNVLMGAYVQVVDSGHGISKNALIREQKAIIQEVVIENDVWIGAGAKILMGVHIGQGVVIGANAVVTQDIPPYSVVGGVPARIIKCRE